MGFNLKLNRSVFYECVRDTLFGGFLEQGQVDGMEVFLNGWTALTKYNDLRWLAYMFATTFHETAQRMQPVRETLASTDDEAIRILDNAFAEGDLPWVSKPYWRYDENHKSWLGRGLVQLTHEENYKKMQEVLGIDITTDPNAALEPVAAVQIMFEGMIEGRSNIGDFTGLSLNDFFNEETDDPYNARKIINGLESADKVEGYHKEFLAALKEGLY